MDEFQKWQAFYGLEPWGDERADLRAGIIASTQANCHRDPKSGKPFKPADFMPDYGKPARSRKQTPQEMHSILKSFAAAQNAATEGRHGKR